MFENINNDPNNQLLYYKVGDKIFHSDLDALEHLSNTINRNQKTLSLMEERIPIRKEKKFTNHRRRAFVLISL